MMKRLVIVVIVCITGCKGEMTTLTAPETQGRIARGHAGERTGLSCETVGGIVLQPTTVMNEKRLLLIPQQFSVMDEEMLRIKYPQERRPTLVFTNESGSVNIAINHTKDHFRQSEFGELHKQMDGMFRNLYPSATWFNSGIIDINGRNWFALNLRTPAIDTQYIDWEFCRRPIVNGIV